MIFFFSSRRRHTRLQGDWSSDVCSSDLQEVAGQVGRLQRRATTGQSGPGAERGVGVERAAVVRLPVDPVSPVPQVLRSEERRVGKECRSRGWGEAYQKKEKGRGDER